MPLGKLFYLKSKLNGYVLDVRGGCCEPGTPVITWPQKASGEGCDNQLWYEDSLEGTIRSKASGLCLDLNDDQELVIAEFSSGRDSQQWLTSGDRVQSRANSSRVLDIKGAEAGEGATVIAWDAHDGDNQRWEVEYTEARFFYIRSKLHDKVLDLKHQDTKPGAKVCMNEFDGTDSQLWYEDRNGVILSKTNDLVIDASDEKIRLQPYSPGNTDQLWTFQGDRIVSRVHPSIVLDIKGSKRKNGAKVIKWQWTGGDNQRWTAEYI